MPRLLSAILLAILVGMGTACSGSKEPAPPQPETTVVVQNDNPLDMAFYVARDTQRIRLGMVSTTDRRSFVIPEYLFSGPTTLQFLVDPIGSDRTYVIERVLLAPGDEFYVSIPTDLR